LLSRFLADHTVKIHVMSPQLPRSSSQSVHGEILAVRARPTRQPEYPLEDLEVELDALSSDKRETDFNLTRSSTRQGQTSRRATGGGDALSSFGLAVNEEQNIDWARGNTHHPRNWPAGRKTFDTSLIIFLDFFTCVPFLLLRIEH
jgi:hypothetical protein